MCVGVGMAECSWQAALCMSPRSIMGLLVLLPVGPKRAAVIHLASSPPRRTSIKKDEMKKERKLFLAGRQEDVAKKERKKKLVCFFGKHRNQKYIIHAISNRIESQTRSCNPANVSSTCMITAGCALVLLSPPTLMWLEC